MHCIYYFFYLLNSLQAGLRPGHSTTTALIKIIITKITILTLFLFSNAFNRVDHGILIAILLYQRLHGLYCIFVADNNKSGVLQGGVLSSLLFSVFINSVTFYIHLCFYHLYADDLQHYIYFKYEH